jgi:hypothetical protein
MSSLKKRGGGALGGAQPFLFLYIIYYYVALGKDLLWKDFEMTSKWVQKHFKNTSKRLRNKWWSQSKCFRKVFEEEEVAKKTVPSSSKWLSRQFRAHFAILWLRWWTYYYYYYCAMGSSVDQACEFDFFPAKIEKWKKVSKEKKFSSKDH